MLHTRVRGPHDQHIGMQWDDIVLRTALYGRVRFHRQSSSQTDPLVYVLSTAGLRHGCTLPGEKWYSQHSVKLKILQLYKSFWLNVPGKSEMFHNDDDLDDYGNDFRRNFLNADYLQVIYLDEEHFRLSGQSGALFCCKPVPQLFGVDLRIVSPDELLVVLVDASVAHHHHRQSVAVAVVLLGHCKIGCRGWVGK